MGKKRFGLGALGVLLAFTGCSTLAPEPAPSTAGKCVETQLAFTKVLVRPAFLAFPDSLTAQGHQSVRLKLNTPVAPQANIGLREFALGHSLSRQASPASCGLAKALFEKPALYCSKAIGNSLEIAVAFEPDTVQNPEQRADALADYVTANVLCKGIE